MASFSTLDNFRILKTLGTGYSGKVKLGQDLATGQTFALKILSSNQPPEQLLQAIMHEFKILKDLSHPSIVKMYDLKNGVYSSRKKGTKTNISYAIVELATGGELFDVIFHSKGFDENLSRYYFRRLVDSMRYLHGQNIAHRDLKPENLLLDNQFNLKVVDFGFATKMQHNRLQKTRLGTEKYMAPEILYHKPYDGKKVDVFAAGVILFVLYSGHPPFNQASEHDPYYKTFVKANDKFWDFHSKQNQKRHYSPEFKALVNNMLSYNSSQRWNFEEIAANSAWIAQPVNEEAAMALTAKYMMEMRAIKEQENASKSSGSNRGEAEDDLKDMMLPDIKFEDLTGVKVENAALNDAVIKSDDKDKLVALVRKTAEEAGITKFDSRGDKLILRAGDEKEGMAIFEIKFFKVAEDKFELRFLRKEGDYFDFQKAKATILGNLNANLKQAAN